MGEVVLEPLRWWEFDAPGADGPLYLTWQFPDNTGRWGGIEFIGENRSTRRNNAFLSRFDQEPQWISESLREAQETVMRIITCRRRLLEAAQVMAPSAAKTPIQSW